jgi:hypothetical protein
MKMAAAQKTNATTIVSANKITNVSMATPAQEKTRRGLAVSRVGS